MSAIALQALAEATGGKLIGESVPLQSLVVDSRQVEAGDLFAAICGQHLDGHDFAPQALARGAAALLTERKLEGVLPQLVVSDVTRASGRFGYLKRQAFTGEIVAITGSAGKTTTKNLIAAALVSKGAVHATEGNQNNELGVPMTLAGLTPSHRFGVIEMGAGRPGDIAYLCELARPDVAVCLNASAAHLAYYDSIEAIAATKGEIFQSLGEVGVAIMNADQQWLPDWRQQAGQARQVTFGLSEAADYRAVEILHKGIEGTEFLLEGPAVSVPVKLNLAGDQHVMNALAAIAVAVELGVVPEIAVKGLEAVLPMAGRGTLSSRSAGGRVVDDSYNANPAAVKAAIDVLARESGYRLLLLGPMLELGVASDALHREIGRYASEAGIDQLIVVGNEAAPAAEVFGPRALHFTDQKSLQASFPALPEEHTIWVKGSRGAGLEQTVAWLLAPGEASSC